MSKNKNYILDEFYVRIPYFSFNKYRITLCDSTTISNFIKTSFRENLLADSVSYYDYKIKQQNNYTKTDLKYLIRSTCRTTPFGLNSGVLVGTFNTSVKHSQNINYSINNKFMKCLRPDYEWLVGMIKKLEVQLGDQLIVTQGDCLIRKNYLKKIWSSCFTYSDTENNSEFMAYNKVLEIIITILDKQKYIKIKELVTLILDYSIHKIDYKFVYQFVVQLLKNEVLISNLRIPLIFTNQLEELLRQLRYYNEEFTLLSELKEINDMIKNYNDKSVGEEVDELNNIILYMNDVYKVDNPVHIDMFSNNKIILDEEIKSDIEDFIDFCSKWSTHNTYQKFIIKFKDKYGSQAVKFLDVIDSQKGLGYPQKDAKDNLILKDDIDNAIFDCIFNSFYKGVIDISKMNDPIFKKDTKNVYGELAVNILKEKNTYQYMVTPLGGTFDTYKSRGRFNHILPLENNFSSDPSFDDVELTFFPKHSHYGNVMTCQSQFKYYVTLGSNIEIKGKIRIDLNDIYLIVLDNKIYFINRKSDRFLKFHISNMFNIDLIPLEFKILLELSHGQNNSFLTLQKSINHIVDKLKFNTPRIVYKNFILYPRTWALSSEVKHYAVKHNFRLFKEFLCKLKKDYSIPNLVIVGSLDQKLLLDISSEKHLEVLYDLVKNNNNIRLEENIFSIENSLVRDSKNNPYISEFVFSFSNREYFKVKANKYEYIEYKDFDKQKELFGDNWISVKIYMPEELMNSFIVNELYSFIKKLQSSFIDIIFYYIRYRDPKSHIRFRIKTNEFTSIIKMVKNFITMQKRVDDFIIDSYLPEINRYGGEKCIKYAEEFFYFDTLSAIDILKSKIKNQLSLDINSIFLCCAMEIYTSFFDEYTLVEKCLYGFKLESEKNELYSKYCVILDNYLVDNAKIQNIDIIRLKILINNKVSELEEYSTIISDFEFNKQKEIVNSLIHMCFNRLIGINRKRETDLMSILSRYIYRKNSRDLYENRSK